MRKAVRHGQASQEDSDRRARFRCEPQSGIHYLLGGDHLGGFPICFFLFFSFCGGVVSFQDGGGVAVKLTLCALEIVGAGCYWEYGV